jgi:tetratricopeptide (TPR) repeat protein
LTTEDLRNDLKHFLSRTLIAACLVVVALAHAQQAAPGSLAEARQKLAAKHFIIAKSLFTAYVKTHPGSVDAEEGLGDSLLGLHDYEAAELQYRRVVADQPNLWLAHKNLVIIEAALGRWDEFDRERALLRAARERSDPGITTRESDIIDSFNIPAKAGQPAQHWIVREYYEPVGRSLTRFNFERFGDDGRVKEYVSLESAQAALDAFKTGDVLRSDENNRQATITDFALDWYNGASHGTIAHYPKGEPTYEQVRSDVMHWLRTQAVSR